MATDKTSSKKANRAKTKTADAKAADSAPLVGTKDPASKKPKQAVQEDIKIVGVPSEENRAEKKQKRKPATEFFDDDEETTTIPAPTKKSKVTDAKATPATKQKKKGPEAPVQDDTPSEEQASRSKTKKAKVSAASSAPEPAPSSEKAIKKPKTDDKSSKKAISSVKPSTKSAPKKASESTKSSKKSKQEEPSPEVGDSDEDAASGSEGEQEEAESEGEEEEEEVELHGFSTDDDDSSDEEMDFDAAPLDVAKLPTIAKDDAVVKKRLEKAKAKPDQYRGVISISRLPHGFYEDQLKAYFSQFGNVTRLRISRNKRTGKSKHYGFVEFDSASVAQIVADTMDNYLMMGHLLQCKVVPKDEVHPQLWVGANRKWRAVPQDRLTRLQHNKPRTEAEKAKAAKRLIKRQNAQKRKLAAAGIKYDFEPVSYKMVKA